MSGLGKILILDHTDYVNELARAERMGRRGALSDIQSLVVHPEKLEGAIREAWADEDEDLARTLCEVLNTVSPERSAKFHGEQRGAG